MTPAVWGVYRVVRWLATYRLETVGVMQDSPELAIFRGDDEPSLVAASLACRACLSGEVEWSLRVDDFEGTVECRCRSCGYVREVSLTSEQTLRLSLEHA
jgi:hypothetical protein